MNNQLITTSLCCLALTYSAAADTFIMKDGSKLEGKILRTDKTAYLVEVKIGKSKSIKDERLIAKADIAKIEQEEPDQPAFVEISKLTPTPDLLTPEEYTQKIHKVTKFLHDYPTSSQSKKAKAILATLKDEDQQIRGGAIKLKGKIIPAAEYKADKYDIDAGVQAQIIRRLINELQYVPALRVFATFDREFHNTKTYQSLLPLINQVITAHLAEAQSLLSTYDERVKARETGLERMASADRSVAENAIREQTAELETRFKREKDSKQGWVTTHEFCKPALEETIQFGNLELTRLAAPANNTPQVDAGAIFRDTLALIQNKGAAPAITAALASAKTALIPQRYIAILEAAR